MTRARDGLPAAPTPGVTRGMRRVGDRDVEDDLMWLRNPALPKEVHAYLEAERAFYEVSTAHLAGRREDLLSSALQRLPETVCTPCWTVAGLEHFFRFPPGHEYQQLVRRLPGGTEVVLLEGESLTKTEFLRLGECVLSPDGRWLAYSLDVLGNEEYDLRIRDTQTGGDLPWDVPHTYYGLQWLPDSTGVLYVCHDDAYRPHQVWLHQLDSAVDVLVLEEPDARFHLALRTSGDGVHAIIRSASRLTSEEWLVLLTDPTAPPISMCGRTAGLDYTAEPEGSHDARRLLVVVNDTNEEYRLIEGELGRPLRSFRELPCGSPGRRLHSVSRRGDHVLVQGREDGQPRVWILPGSGSGTDGPIVLGPDEPGGTVRIEAYDAGGEGSICIATESRRTPPVWYSVRLATGDRHEIARQPAGVHDPDDYRTEVLCVVARDGVAVPVTVHRRADTPLDGTAPCLLYGYGAWEHVIEPSFDPVLMSLLDTGVVFAHAHVRGGGELGRHWWLRGRMDTKRRTFTDFIDVADHLAASLIDGDRLIARGFSAGGLLMGAAYSQRPDRWLGVIAEAPFVDPVTTMSDETAPLVITEREEWGDPRRAADREWMLGWSPYDNCPPLPRRPALLVTSAVNDPRVSVWEPARWVAKLRRSGSMDERLLFRCDVGARGHWPPPGRHARLIYEAEILAWAAHEMNPRGGRGKVTGDEDHT